MQAGAAQYATCMACHGPSGEGNPALNAPRLAGQQAWYVGRQLRAFRAGLRGTHQNDTYGAQMRAFATMLPDEAAIRNLAAYVETLPGHEPQTTVSGDAKRGRRLFTMAPIHHGLQLKGGIFSAGPERWHESTIVVRAWIVAGACAMASLALLKVR